MRPTAAAIGCALLLACGSGGTRDVVPKTRDVQLQELQAHGSYLFVARRPFGFVALTSEEGMEMELATNAVEHIANAMDSCATNLAQKSKLVDGAIRMTLLISPEGSVTATRVTVAPGDAVAANALLCVMSPVKLMTFAPAAPNAPGRAIGIDATWGPLMKGE